MLIECHFADIHIFCEIVDFQLAELCFSYNGFYFSTYVSTLTAFLTDKCLPLMPLELIITNFFAFHVLN